MWTSLRKKVLFRKKPQRHTLPFLKRNRSIGLIARREEIREALDDFDLTLEDVRPKPVDIPELVQHTAVASPLCSAVTETEQTL
jgi:hypothetical protein